MLKDPDKPKESAAKRATRRWKNHEISMRFKSEKTEANAALLPEQKEPLVIITEKPLEKTIAQFQRRFKKEITALMKGLGSLSAFEAQKRS